MNNKSSLATMHRLDSVSHCVVSCRAEWNLSFKDGGALGGRANDQKRNPAG